MTGTRRRRRVRELVLTVALLAVRTAAATLLAPSTPGASALVAMDPVTGDLAVADADARGVLLRRLASDGATE